MNNGLTVNLTRPTPNGELWVFNKDYTQYLPVSLYDIQAWVGSPAIFVYDCSGTCSALMNCEEEGGGFLLSSLFSLLSLLSSLFSLFSFLSSLFSLLSLLSLLSSLSLRADRLGRVD